MTDFELDLLPNKWIHPETGCTILGEHMPWELLPTAPVKYRYESLASALETFELVIRRGRHV